ncbi:DNA repair protein RecN [Larsenimonas salina]|uniref:DNA repair protein RecN n=1 Tax=Larsenimonas salina TaxID=1295565 RepID=UPI00207438B4|nr:DNA repair protein RecN [Larsenimonas salina]MCM5705232.1 DNA repair protein RecN [Larsenimonas salina]
MLAQLSIHHYAIVDALDLDFRKGMTAITGETGAGKSILLGALGLCLGDRADAANVRHGAKQADISARFDIQALPSARDWLSERELDTEDCLIRRVVTTSGRSKAWINGTPCTASDLKQLGEHLIEVHGQHAHHALMREETHLRLVDELAGHQEGVQSLKGLHRQWQSLRRDIRARRENSSERDARLQLLRYQVEELDELALQEGELGQLEAEHTRLSHAEQSIQTTQHALDECGDEQHGALTRLSSALGHLGTLPDAQRKTIEPILTMLEEARIQLSEAVSDLTHHQSSIELDPTRLAFVEERLSTAHTIARKHYVNPEELTGLHATLAHELSELDAGPSDLSELEAQAQTVRDEWRALAATVSDRRAKAAIQLTADVEAQLKFLGMEKARFEVAVTPLEKPQPEGLDHVQFLMSANPGQPMRPLHKVASGGELSRISLAIQVATATHSKTPTLVFDEVDVGISGATAEIVGQLLRELGGRGQVMCVTHLPQVAAQAHQHLHIEKQADEHQTHTSMLLLDRQGRVRELARMLGGVHLSQQTLAHAREMLKSGQSDQRH